MTATRVPVEKTGVSHALIKHAVSRTAFTSYYFNVEKGKYSTKYITSLRNGDTKKYKNKKLYMSLLFHLFPIEVCHYKGQDIRVGQNVPAGDDCNTCTCNADGSVTCTEKICCKYICR